MVGFSQGRIMPSADESGEKRPLLIPQGTVRHSRELSDLPYHATQDTIRIIIQQRIDYHLKWSTPCIPRLDHCRHYYKARLLQQILEQMPAEQLIKPTDLEIKYHVNTTKGESLHLSMGQALSIRRYPTLFQTCRDKPAQGYLEVGAAIMRNS